MDAPITPTQALEQPQLTKSVTSTRDELSEAIAIKAHLADGLTLQEAAVSLGLSLSTAYRRLRLVEVDDERAVAKLLQMYSLRFTHNWLTASEKAAEKGDHRPAKDALLHARAIEPVVDGNNQGGARIAIIIGTPEQPIRVAAPQPVVVEPL